jgi:hypothetical protein
LDGYDFSQQFTELMVNRSSESLDVSTMGSQTRKHKGGVQDVSVTGKGFVNLGTSLMDGIIFGKVGIDATLATVFMDGIPNVACSTAGGYGISGVSVKHIFGGSYGTVLPFDLDIQTQSALSPVVVLSNTLSTAYGDSGPWSTGANNGAAVPLSTNGMSTSEKLYGGFHITTMSTALNSLGISAVIAAASSSGFATSNTRITFSAKTCKSGTWGTPVASGALSTDQPYIRAVITVATGTSSGNQATGLIWGGMI